MRICATFIRNNAPSFTGVVCVAPQKKIKSGSHYIFIYSQDKITQVGHWLSEIEKKTACSKFQVSKVSCHFFLPSLKPTACPRKKLGRPSQKQRISPHPAIFRGEPAVSFRVPDNVPRKTNGCFTWNYTQLKRRNIDPNHHFWGGPAVTLPKTNSSPLKIGPRLSQEETSLRTIHSQGQTVSFREGKNSNNMFLDIPKAPRFFLVTSHE